MHRSMQQAGRTTPYQAKRASSSANSGQTREEQLGGGQISSVASFGSVMSGPCRRGSDRASDSTFFGSAKRVVGGSWAARKKLAAGRHPLGACWARFHSRGSAERRCGTHMSAAQGPAGAGQRGWDRHGDMTVWTSVRASSAAKTEASPPSRRGRKPLARSFLMSVSSPIAAVAMESKKGVA